MRRGDWLLREAIYRDIGISLPKFSQAKIHAHMA